MENIKKIVLYSFTCAAAALLDTAAPVHFRLLGFFDFSLGAVLLFALLGSMPAGYAAAFILGLYKDAVLMPFVGINALVLVLAVFCAGFLCKKLFKKNLNAKIFIFAASVLISYIFYWVLVFYSYGNGAGPAVSGFLAVKIAATAAAGACALSVFHFAAGGGLSWRKQA